MPLIQVSINSPVRVNLTWEQRWIGPDNGLIAAWEAGRDYADANPSAAKAARQGALIVLPWRGGVEPEAKPTKKPRSGTLLYACMLSGVKGEDLDVDPCAALELTCRRTGVVVLCVPEASTLRAK